MNYITCFKLNIKAGFIFKCLVAVRRIFFRLLYLLDIFLQLIRDISSDTHLKQYAPVISNSFISIKDLDIANITSESAHYLSDMYCSHRFDLLGSGWVKNGYESDVLGVEGNKYNNNVLFDIDTMLLKPHRKKAKLIYDLVAKDYTPIDWQKDFKSGYRWCTRKWYRFQSYGRQPGVDVKVPWELSRMHHLTQIAIFSIVSPSLKKQNIREFKNQVLDFIATNPPNMGVNWDPMEAGIRVVNMLIAFDIFSQIDDEIELDNRFKQLFSNSVYEHALFIANNLEWSKEITTNHYLSNLIGLLYASAYLNRDVTSTAWLVFSIKELQKEIDKQFYDDGGNFESSTSYHRLSSEIMVMATAMFSNLSHLYLPEMHYVISNRRLKYYVENDNFKVSLSSSYINKLYKMGRFTNDMIKPNSEVVQIGDNDSGRLIKLSPNGKFVTNFEAESLYINLKGYRNLIGRYENDKELFWDENILNHNSLIGLFSGLFETRRFESSFQLEKSLVSSIAKSKLEFKKVKTKMPNKNSDVSLKDLTFKDRKVYRLINKVESLKLISYPDSGIYIYKSKDVFLAICLTPIGQNNHGGHSHNDKLSYELYIDNRDVEKDAGTYLYSSLPIKRNMFRSTRAHNVPLVNGVEQNSFELNGIFRLQNESKSTILKIRNDCIEVLLEYGDVKIVRSFCFKDGLLIVEDRCNRRFRYEVFGYYSNGYGKIMYA